ncbi:MAG: hypothetical protein QXK93_00100 [Candidatus Bathyarchaeia archaeon]
MRPTIKALGWMIILLWIITLALPISVAFSLFKLAEGGNVGVQEPTFTVTNGNISINMPIYVNNTGFYDISDVNIEIRIRKIGTIIATMSKNLPSIPAGQIVNTSCSFTANIVEIFQKDHTLLTEDADLDLNIMLHFRVAYTLAFNIAYNSSMRWGAPFHDLTYTVDYNEITHVFSFYMSFNNHASFSISGPFTIELYNSNNERIGIASLDLNVPAGEAFQESVDVVVDFSKMTDMVLVCLSFAELKILEEWWTKP